MLRCHFLDRPDVYVSGNLFIYYREGDPPAAEARDGQWSASAVGDLLRLKRHGRSGRYPGRSAVEA